MTRKLVFLHTAPSNVEPFGALAASLAPDVEVEHIVDASLLNDARAHGITPDLQQRVDARVQSAVDAGADLVLCTCSSIGECAEQSAQQQIRPVLRVDRAMARAAVAQGTRIVVFATLASTLAPTKALILDEARRANKQIEIEEVICDAAWARLEAGDQNGYLDEVAAALQAHAHSGDVLVLAQASMAQAATRAGDLPVPVLTSPSLGMEDALARLD